MKEKENLPMKRKLLCLLVVLALALSIPVPGYAASAMKASDDCLAVIKAFEGFSGKPYRDSDGGYTIGYGTRCPSDKVDYYTKNPMSEAEAEAELRKEMVSYENAVNAFMDKHGISFTQGQFDGVISLVFNCGVAWLNKGSTLIKALTEGDTGNDLIYAFTIYSMNSGNRSIGHVKRRLAEANMYLNASYSRTPPEHYSYVLYDGNGGELSTYNVQGYDTTIPVAPVPTATYPGKTFRGWYTKATGGVKVTKLDASTKTMTLYAQWGAAGETVPEDQPSVIIPDENVSQITGSLIPSGSGIGAVKVTVTNNSVNLRKGPGTGYAVVGTANKGAQYTITSTYQDKQYLWGRFSGGWICLDYTDYKADTATKPETGAVTKTYATVSGTDSLNVRQTPDGTVIGSLPEGTKVEILEQKTVNNRLWGRYSGGWICMRSFVKLETVTLTPTTVTKTYATVVGTDTLNIRETPDGKVVGSLPEGTRVEILEQKTVNDRLWGRCSDGWICLRSYAKLETVTQVVYQDAQTTQAQKNSAYGQVTASTLNVRQTPGVNSRIVSWLRRGASVQILQYAKVNGTLWGRTKQGWICLRYVKMK